MSGGIGTFLDVRYLQRKKVTCGHKKGTFVTFTVFFDT
jgi:hypothetical protein